MDRVLNNVKNQQYTYTSTFQRVFLDAIARTSPLVTTFKHKTYTITYTILSSLTFKVFNDCVGLFDIFPLPIHPLQYFEMGE